MLASILDLTSAIHGLSGHLQAVDAVMEFTASSLIFASALVLVAAWLRRDDGLRACVAAGAGCILAAGLSALIGMAWDRPRPFVAGHFVPLISHAADASFPSDHLAVLGALCAALWLASRKLGYVTALLAAAVAFARVYVGIHYVSDVAGGFALGLLCGWAAWVVTGRLSSFLEPVDSFLATVHLRPVAVNKESQAT
jgi:undecaprenyl-diphosphatase